MSKCIRSLWLEIQCNRKLVLADRWGHCGCRQLSERTWYVMWVNFKVHKLELATLINMQYFKKKDRKKDYLFKKYSLQSFLKSIVQIKCYKVSILMQAWWLTISSLFNFEIWYFWPQTFISKNPPLLNRYSSIAVLQDTCIHFCQVFLNYRKMYVFLIR